MDQLQQARAQIDEIDAKMALDIANRAYVLETGTIKMEGEATELANNIEVRKAYLGCE